MTKYMILLSFLSFHFIAFNQTITGLVIDKKTKKEIPSTTIYFSGTSCGTSSDQNGKFELDISKHASRPITISAIGYYSNTIEDFSDGEQLTIKLIPKIYNINEAIVSSKSLVRKRRANLRLFREEFLGTTDNSWDCKILNEEDITFNYFEDEDTLKAYTKKPLIIENKALGYNITYYLDVFEYYKDSKYVFFSGNFIFEEDSLADQELVQKNREYVYRGSRMHFLRSLWVNELFENNFRIVDSKNKRVRYKDIIIEDENHNKFIKYKGSLRVYYHEIESKLIISKLIYFDKKGNFSLEGIWWTGAMGERRISDWLPSDYRSEYNK
ncbi:carboxypeptidase-like regulatory domain-containing protein [Bacteroidota bacterium]